MSVSATSVERLPEPPTALETHAATEFDPAATRVRYVVPYGNHNVLVGAAALTLLNGAREGRGLTALAQELDERGLVPPSGGSWSSDDVRHAYAAVIGRLPDLGAPPRSSRFGLWCVIPLIPESAVRAWASRLAWLFVPSVALPTLLLSVALVAVGLFRTGVGIPNPDGSAFWLGYVLFVLIIFVHELGHATAASSQGTQPSRIGFALYLIWPSLWSDVSESWRLSPRRRLIVDLGGIQLQLLGTGLLAAVAIAAPMPTLRAAILFSLSSMVLTLNPFMRFDAYWALTDVLGVPHLGTAGRRAVLGLFGRASVGDAEPTDWRRPVLAVYCVLGGMVWTAFAVILSVRLPLALIHLSAMVKHVSLARVNTADGNIVMTAVGLAIDIVVLTRLAIAVRHRFSAKRW